MTSTADRNYQQFNTQWDEIIERMDAANQLVTEAREWLRDLYWTDDDAEEQIAEASDTYILRQIRRHYDGGVQGFMQDIA